MFKRIVFTILSFFLFCTFALAVEVGFTWNPNTESDLAGYRLYQSKVSGVYVKGVDTAVSDIPVGTEGTVIQITRGGTYFWVLTAYDEYGNESGFSNEVSEYFNFSAPANPGGLKTTTTKTTHTVMTETETVRIVKIGE